MFKGCHFDRTVILLWGHWYLTYGLNLQDLEEMILEADVEARLNLSEADIAGEQINIRNSKYMNNRIEKDHRRIKRRVGPMLGFKSTACADIILSGVELVNMIRKG